MNRTWIRKAITCLSLIEIAFAGHVHAMEEAAAPKRAVALLNATKGNRAQGAVTFTALEEGGVLIVADVDHLEPGKHGFNIHEFGDCSAADGSSIGAHFNPTRSKHGGPDHLKRHIGDLGNIVADDRGHGAYQRIDKSISLQGEHSIIGRSIAIHANADDFTAQPTGNSGGCISCGIIE